MTFRKLLEMMQQFAVDRPGHESLDRQVVLRLDTDQNLEED